MGFKLLKREEKKNSSSGITDEEFINFLLENHNLIKVKNKDIREDNISLPDQEEKKNNFFDFLRDDKKELARERAIFDIENSIIDKKEVKNDDQIVDRRKKKRK